MNLTPFFLLIQDSAPATGAPAAAPPPEGIMGALSGMFFPLILCFGVFWFLILRPEQKNRKVRALMLSNMKKGDKVMTNSGLYGTIVQVQDGIVTLQIAEGVRVRYALSAIQSVEQEGSEKVAEAKAS